MGEEMFKLENGEVNDSTSEVEDVLEETNDEALLDLIEEIYGGIKKLEVDISRQEERAEKLKRRINNESKVTLNARQSNEKKTMHEKNIQIKQEDFEELTNEIKESKTELKELQDKFYMLKLVLLEKVKENFDDSELKDTKLPLALKLYGYNNVRAYVAAQIQILSEKKNNDLHLQTLYKKFNGMDKNQYKGDRQVALETLLRTKIDEGELGIKKIKNKRFTRKVVLGVGILALAAGLAILSTKPKTNNNNAKETTEQKTSQTNEPPTPTPKFNKGIQCPEEGLLCPDGTIISKEEVEEVNQLVAEGKYDQIDKNKLSKIGLRIIANKVNDRLKVMNYSEDGTAVRIESGDKLKVRLVTIPKSGNMNYSQGYTLFVGDNQSEFSKTVTKIIDTTSTSPEELVNIIVKCSKNGVILTPTEEKSLRGNSTITINANGRILGPEGR